MRMRAGANDRQTIREKGHPAIPMPRPTQKHRRNNPARRDPPSPEPGKKRIRVPKHVAPSKRKLRHPDHSRRRPILRPKFGLTDEMPAMSKSNRLRIEPSRTEALFAMFSFFRATGRARCSLHLETEIGMLLER